MQDALVPDSGVGVVASRNLRFLQKYFGSDNCDAILLGDTERKIGAHISVFQSGLTGSKIQRIISVLCGTMGGINSGFRRILHTYISTKKPDLIWIDIGQYASLCSLIRKLSPQTYIIVFCHNVEYDYFRTQAEAGPRGIKNRILAFAASVQEKTAARMADRLIFLHGDDAERFNKLYGRSSNDFLPVSFGKLKDGVPSRIESAENADACGPSYFLFVGSLFPPNYDGIRWFAKEVLPLVRGDLVIAGKGFEKVAGELEGPRCHVLGYVHNLDSLYSGADFIISPIFTGGGMKVKVGEALSKGKTIIGTAEALRGYKVTNRKEVLVANTVLEFVEAIKFIYSHEGKGLIGYNSDSRTLYEEQYSEDAVYNSFGKLMARMEFDNGK